jgi:hypothetical protein
MLEFNDEMAPYEIPLEAYGVEVRICTNVPELLDRTIPLLPPGWQECAATPVQHRLGILAEDDGTFTVYNGAARAVQGQGLELSLIVLDGQIRGYVALRAPGMTFVHAGAVAHEGRAIMFPGHSFAGKTTLVAALVRGGAIYYSDEFAVLDGDGLVHPYAKPLSLRDNPENRQIETDVELLGGVAGDEPLPLGLVVFTRFRSGAQWRPEPISRGAAALKLVENTVSVRSRPDEAMHAVTAALTDAVALEGTRGEAEEIVDQLLERALA